MSKDNKNLRPIDQPIYGYWAAIFASFFSKQLYVDVGKRWQGFGFRYLFLVLVLLAIPLSIRIAANFNQAFDENIIAPMKELPLLYVQNGIISMDKGSPYFSKNKRGEVVLIVDTSGKITSFTNDYPNLSILINKDVIYMRLPEFKLVANQLQKNNAKPIPSYLDKSMNELFSGAQFISQPRVSRLKLTAQIIIYPITLIMVFSIFVSIILVLGVLGQIFSNVFFTFQISYIQACRMLTVSITPMLFLLFAYLSINKLVTGFGSALMIIYIAYYCFALKSLRAESRKVVA